MALTETSRSLKLMCCFSEEVRSRIVRAAQPPVFCILCRWVKFSLRCWCWCWKKCNFAMLSLFFLFGKGGDLALFILPLSITVCSLPTTFLLAFPARTLICVPSSKICYLRLQTFEEQRYIVWDFWSRSFYTSNLEGSWTGGHIKKGFWKKDFHEISPGLPFLRCSSSNTILIFFFFNPSAKIFVFLHLWIDLGKCQNIPCMRWFQWLISYRLTFTIQDTHIQILSYAVHYTFNIQQVSLVWK